MDSAYSVVQSDTGAVILESVAYASSIVSLTVGLIGSPNSAVSLWLPRTSIIHTFGMRYPLDVLFVDAVGVVLRVCLNVAPGRLVIGPKRTNAVLETKSQSPSVFIAIQPGASIRLTRMAAPSRGTQPPLEPL